MKVIAHQELTSSAASITFSSIPTDGTYTDLRILLSSRDVVSTATIYISLNGSTSSFTSMRLYGTGGSVATNTTNRVLGITARYDATANTFGNAEIYIPNYSSSTQYKSVSADVVSENNTATAYQTISANTWAVNDAITSVTISVAGEFGIGTTATLYGILAGSDGTTTVS